MTADDPLQLRPEQTPDKEEKAAEDRRITALRDLLGTDAGRTYLWWVLGQAGVMDNSFDRDPHVTSFKEGRRALGSKILADILRVAPGRYIEMMKEGYDAGSGYNDDDPK